MITKKLTVVVQKFPLQGAKVFDRAHLKTYSMLM